MPAKPIETTESQRKDHPPLVYLLYGEDEYAIDQFIRSIREKMGEPAMAELNTTRFEGGKFSLSDLNNTIASVPFLIERRLVILDGPLRQLQNPSDRKQFKAILENVPPSTGVVIIERWNLIEKNKKINWLLKWAEKRKESVFIKHCLIPKGHVLSNWIRKEARNRGGEIDPRAADLLGSLVEGDTQRTVQEIEKLLTYVNFQRPVDVDDVGEVAIANPQGDIFIMVDAIGNRNGSIALKMLHQLLEVEEPMILFSMVIRQFRLLLQTKEIVSKGATSNDILSEIHEIRHHFIAEKLIRQSRNFSSQMLEAIYRKLLEVDELIKTGKMEVPIALDTLIATLTT